jgi:hypothetical protein
MAPVPPGLDLGVDLLVEVRDRAWANPRAPEGFGDVLHPPNRNPRQIHLDQTKFKTSAVGPAEAPGLTADIEISSAPEGQGTRRHSKRRLWVLAV